MSNEQRLIKGYEEKLRARGYSLSDYSKAWSMILESAKVEELNGKFKVLKVETENNKTMFPVLLNGGFAVQIDNNPETFDYYREFGGHEADVPGIKTCENNYLFAYGESFIVQVSIRFMSFGNGNINFVIDDNTAKGDNRVGDFTALAWDFNTYKHLVDNDQLTMYEFLNDGRGSIARNATLTSGDLPVEVCRDVFLGHSVIRSILNTREQTMFGVKSHDPRNPWDVLIEELDKLDKQFRNMQLGE
jgi:hypothetical protein